MRKVFIVLVFFLCGQLHAQNTELLTQEIQYECEGANEVVLVWGVNNWNIPAENLWVPGSIMEGNLLHTPMEKSRGSFSVSLRVPAGTTVDYVFHITRGPLNKKTDIWDVNEASKKDFHAVVLNDNTAKIQSTVSVVPREMISVLDFAPSLLFPAALIFLLFAAARIFFFKNSENKVSAYSKVVAVSAVLIVFHFFTRASVTGLGWDLYFTPTESFLRLFYLSYYDILYVSLTATLFIILFFLFRKHAKVSKGILALFVGISVVNFVTAIINIRVVEMLGKPFTWQWLYYSDFLQSSDAKSALSANFSIDYAASIFAVMLSAFFMCIVLSYFIQFLTDKINWKKLMAAPLLFFPVYFVVASQKLNELQLKKEKLVNPVAAFISSVNPFSSSASLFTMKVPQSLKNEFNVKTEYTGNMNYPEFKNVIVVVLESTPAEYISGYAPSFQVTPFLNSHLDHSIIFENVYAHAPATNNSLVSLFGSLYPWLSYNSITREHPDLDFPTLSSELKKYNYKTAFFNSADNRFQRAGEFLENRRLDCINDCRNKHCDKIFEVNENWDFPNGEDDECTADEMLEWIDARRQDPFFAVMWTYQTHYPYFFSGEKKIYNSEDSIFNRYLNAVEHSDKVLGKILSGLEKRNLFDSTLVVVVGDHGEAFGEHDQTTHASNIFEENIHVPCIFINPAFKGEKIQSCGGLIDIAPTVMNLLGFSGPGEWQGENLFTCNKDRRVYFFTPWGDYQFGYREKNLKFIYNATSNTTSVYDLASDPDEKFDLAPTMKDEVRRAHLRLAAWVQWHSEYLNNIIKTKK